MKRLFWLSILILLLVGHAHAQMHGTFGGNLYGPGFKSYLYNAPLKQFMGYLGGVEQIRIDSDGKLVWLNDTNLYRSAADTLKTDDAFTATGLLTGTAGAVLEGITYGLTADGVDVSAHDHSGAGQGGTVTAASVTNVAAGNIAAVNLQAAVNELDTEKLEQSRIVTVGASGCDFATIQGAINSIGDEAAGNRYVVLVHAGTYTENVLMAQYISVVGVSREQVIIAVTGTAGPAGNCLTLASDSTLAEVTVQTPDQLNAPLYAIRAGAAANAIVRDCVVDGITGGDISSVNCRFVRNRVRHPNPFWLYGTGHEVAYNQCIYDGVGSNACLGFMDAQESRSSHIHHNYAYLKATNVAVDTAYGVSVLRKGNIFAHNNVTTITARQNIRGILLIGLTNLDLGLNEFRSNTFRLHSTHATPHGAAIAGYRSDSIRYIGDILAVGNTIYLTGDNPGTWYQFFNQEASWYEDVWSLPPVDSAVIYADAASLGYASGATLRRMGDYRLVLLRSGRKTPKVQLHRDLLATDTDSIIAAGSAIDMTDGTPVIMTALSMPDIARNLRVVSTGPVATGTVTFYGYDYQGRYQTEAITLDAINQDVLGAKAFGSFWYYQVTATGVGAATLGHGDIVALECDISAAGDVRGMAAGAGAVRPPITAPGAVSATNMTVDCAVINANDDVEILYEGLED